MLLHVATLAGCHSNGGVGPDVLLCSSARPSSSSRCEAERRTCATLPYRLFPRGPAWSGPGPRPG